MNTQNAASSILILLHIDGLGYEILRWAIENGYAPNIGKLAADPNYMFSPWQSGVPSETEPVVAQLLWGERIPGNDWYSKETMSPVDGDVYEELLKRRLALSGRHGLLEQGFMCVCEMSGGASAGNSRFCRKTLLEGFAREGKIRTVLKEARRDLPDLFAHPLAVPGILGRFVVNAWRMRRYLKRHGQYNTWSDRHYPLMISASDYVFPPLITQCVKRAVKSGLRRFYGDLSGYDEKAHYTGIRSAQAFQSIRLIDEEVGKIKTFLQQCGRPYELVLFSDHGQTTSRLFTTEYRQTVSDWINDQAGRSIAPRAVQVDEIVTAHDYPLLNVYFNRSKSVVGYHEIEEAYPGLIKRIVNHPAVGLLLVREGGLLFLFGKNGYLVLRPDKFINRFGDNPLSMYIDKYQSESILCQQLSAYAKVEGTGDLILFSTLFNAGSDDQYVIDFNTTYSLVAGHGGLGGPQKVPFILYRKGVLDLTGVFEAAQLHPQLARL